MQTVLIIIYAFSKVKMSLSYYSDGTIERFLGCHGTFGDYFGHFPGDFGHSRLVVSFV